MSAQRLHLVRHGEVYNPTHVLYGRLPHFELSPAGHEMAAQAAEYLKDEGREVTRIVTSPLLRTRQSAHPHEELWGLEADVDSRLIEPANAFEGKVMKKALLNPLNWWKLRDPKRPSWGEPYQSIVDRMLLALDDAWFDTSDGDVVLVSHQLPIWMTHLAVAGEPLWHNPTKRRCALSSVTSFERTAGGGWREVAYAEPASTAGAVDVGAV